MQILVDIPNEKSEKLIRQMKLDRNFRECKIIELSKGHGRLIDADSMKTMKNIQSANFNAVELIRLWIDKQDTIIEADNSESEEN